MMTKYKNTLIALTGAWTVASCAIENDIPYPLRDGSFTALQVEGQCDAQGNAATNADIDKNTRTVQLYVDDTADPARLRITRINVTNEATVMAPESQCYNYNAFPQQGFDALDQLDEQADTRVDFSREARFTLRTYQDYLWTVKVEIVITRTVVLQNQVGDAVIDPVNRNIVVYVAQEQDLSQIKVTDFKPQGLNCTVVPNPMEVESVDFTQPVTYQVKGAWQEVAQEWTVYVYHSDGTPTTDTEIVPRTKNALISGSIQQGKTPQIEYRLKSESSWKTLDAQYIQVSGTSYTATLPNLTPATNYAYRVTITNVTGDEQSFKTAPATALTDGSMDNWHQVEKLWNPWSASGSSFWDTGNRGATTVGESNTVPTDDTATGSGKAALLESKWVVIKFAGGNIFSGTYVKTDGTNGVLNFGRPFSGFPEKLSFSYKYSPAVIDKIGSDHSQLEYLKGRPDSCHIYVALAQRDEPYEIRTRASELKLFDKNDKDIIAYAELIQGKLVDTYTTVELPLEYRDNRIPNYLVIVATSSKYADYFTGGVGSKLWLDNFELIY